MSDANDDFDDLDDLEVDEDLTRVVIIRGDTRTEYWADKWDVDIQDNGQTIKLFATGDGAEPIRVRNIDLACDLGITIEQAIEVAQLAAEQQGQPDRFKR